MIRQPYPQSKRDPSIALINIVFLMLIFFLIAGTIAPPLDRDLELVDVAELEGREPPDALVLKADGVLSYRGAPIEAQQYMQGHGEGPVRIVPDRNSSGQRLVALAAELRGLGATTVILVTQRALP
ncbi:MAG: ExbD/TolR family protein [Arenibacterium sp.]